MKLSFKNRLILGIIIFLVAFIGMAIFGSIKVGFWFGIGVFILNMVFTSPAFAEWNKERVKRFNERKALEDEKRRRFEEIKLEEKAKAEGKAEGEISGKYIAQKNIKREKEQEQRRKEFIKRGLRF